MRESFGRLTTAKNIFIGFRIYLILKFFLFVLFFFTGCGFAYERKIKNSYFLVGVDSKEDVSICYKLSNGDCVGRIPSRVKEYFFNDSLIVAKTINSDLMESYYLLNTLKDSEYSDYTKSGVLLGPMTREKFDSVVITLSLNIQFIKL